MTARSLHRIGGALLIALATGCATSSSDRDWPAQVITMKQLRAIEPMKVPLQWGSGDGRPTGAVEMRGHPHADGSIGKVQILTSSGRKEIDQSAVVGLKTARFQPFVQDGRPGEATVNVRVSFSNGMRIE